MKVKISDIDEKEMKIVDDKLINTIKK